MRQLENLRSDASGAPPFFIVGSARSGSTLLRMMLVSHSRIAIPPETWFLLSLVDQLPLERVLDSSELQRAIALIASDYRWPDMKISAEDLANRATQLISPRIRDLAELIYGVHLEGSGKARWGDKTPPYVKIVPQLCQLFPGARFIYLVRDGRDVTKSIQKLMMYGRTIRQNSIEWTEANRWERKWRALGYADRILHVRYEDLVLNPEPTLRGICEFIGEQFEPQMLAWQDSIERMLPKRERHIHSKLTRDMRHEDVERWRREMNASELFVAEALMGPDLRGFGYEMYFRSPFWRPVLWLTRVYCDFILPINPLRALRVLVRLCGNRLSAVECAAEVNGGAGTKPIEPKVWGPDTRAVDPAKVRWRGFSR